MSHTAISLAWKASRTYGRVCPAALGKRVSLIKPGGDQFSMHKYYLSNAFVGFAYGTQLYDASCPLCRAGVCVRRVVGTYNHVCQVEHNAASQLN